MGVDRARWYAGASTAKAEPVDGPGSPHEIRIDSHHLTSSLLTATVLDEKIRISTGNVLNPVNLFL